MKLNIKHISFYITTFALTALVFAGPAVAQECDNNGPYGASTCVSEISIDKKVAHPIDEEKGGQKIYVDNLGSGDHPYTPQTEVFFQITVTNTGDNDMQDVIVNDTLPQYLDNPSVDDDLNPKYNSGDKELTFTLKDLKAGQSRTVEVSAMVSPNSSFPEDDNVFCVLNRAKATGHDRSDEDTAQLCIQTNVKGATTLPDAGFEDWLVIMPFIFMAAAGVYLLIPKAKVQG